MKNINYNICNINAIIGLGNPGTKYYRDRHNIGFRILDNIAKSFNVDWHEADKMKYSKIFIHANEVVSVYLIKPQTFMNNSGLVIPFLKKKGIRSENILVVHDELEKDFGKMNFKFGGSARGHNGLRSIINMIGYDFWRFRFGIGRPENKKDVADYVLSNFTKQEEEQLEILLTDSVNKIIQK